MTLRMDADFWTARMAFLSKIARADAIAVVIEVKDGGFASYAADNLPGDPGWNGALIGPLIRGALETRQPEQAAVPMTLADGRAASAICVAPITWNDQLVGALAALRSGSDFDEREIAALARLADLVGLELAEAAALRRAQSQQNELADGLRRTEEDRKQALLLYELSRLATIGNDPQEDLETAAAMIGDTLGADIVGVWGLEPDGLRLRAGRGYPDPRPTSVPLGELGPAMTVAVRQQELATARFTAGDTRRPGWAPADGTFVIAPIGSEGDQLGAILLGRRTGTFADAEAEFTTTIADYLAGRLKQTAAGTDDEIAVNERKKVAQEIHDGIAQELTGVVLTLEACQRALDRDPATLARTLAKAAREARATLADVRQYMSALRAKEGGDMNLPSTVARLVDDVRRQTGLRVEMEEQGAERELEPPLERAVMRIVGESLRNVAQHAHATAAKLRLDYGEREINIVVEDDGVGFDAESTIAVATETGHFGLAGMRERAESIGGAFTVLSQPGRGTVITATLPYFIAEDPLRTMREATPVLEDVEPPVERSGLISKLFGR